MFQQLQERMDVVVSPSNGGKTVYTGTDKGPNIGRQCRPLKMLGKYVFSILNSPNPSLSGVRNYTMSER